MVIEEVPSTGGNGSIVGGSLTFSAISNIALDPIHNRAFVLDAAIADREIFSVDLTTGRATKIYQNTNFIMGAGFTYNPVDENVYFTQQDGSGVYNLYKVSANTQTPSSGTLVSQFVGNGGVAFMALDLQSNILFLRTNTNGLQFIDHIDLTNNAVTQLSITTPPAGSPLAFQSTTSVSFSPTTSSPVDNATNVPENTTITLQFTGPVIQGSSGNIVVHDLTTNTIVETIPVTDSRLSGWGTNSIAIATSGNLPPDQLAVQWDAGVFYDQAFNSLPANSSNTQYEFSVALCFCAGTMIATPAGEVPVDQLAVGDMVLTCRGNGPRRVTWIGSGQVLATRGQRNAATPVVIHKNALGDKLPHQDLRVTKGHAIHLDGALIPVEFLVNHRSIVWDDHAQEVRLWHIELDQHDVILANGAPAESYRDDGNRWLFRNARSAEAPQQQLPCAPLLTGGLVVDTAWRRLLARSGPRPGVPTTDQPDVHLLVDEQRIDFRARCGSTYSFRLPGCAKTVRIISRAGVPTELGTSRDPRSLGVALRRIMLWRGARLRILEATDATLRVGFHNFEADDGWRWTNGDALIPAALFSEVTGPCELQIQIACSALYPLFNETRLAA